MEETSEDSAAFTKLRKDHPPCAEEKDLLKQRSTAKMVFTKKVNLFQDRLSKKDPYDALKN